MILVMVILYNRAVLISAFIVMCFQKLMVL